MNQESPLLPPERARLAADERALIRRQWHAPWAKRERAIHRLLWPGWPTALAVVAAIAAWVLHVLGEPVAALGALAVLLAASLWLVWQLHRRTATRQRVRATLQAAANALRSRGVSADIEPRLQWLEHHWAWDTPTALYGPKGVTVHCQHVAGGDLAGLAAGAHLGRHPTDRRRALIPIKVIDR